MSTADEIAQLREGWLIDYDMQTWTVTEADVGPPVDEWTLKDGTDVRFLEREYSGSDVFRLFEPVRISAIAVADERKGGRQPFLAAIREGRAPSTIVYQDEEYVLAEKDVRIDTDQGLTMVREKNPEERASDESTGEWARSADGGWLMGVCAGYAEHHNMSPTHVRVFWFMAFMAFSVFAIIAYFLVGISKPVESTESDRRLRASGEKRTHYWVYETGSEFVALECYGYNDWDAYAGREVAPHEFDDILPGSKK